MKDDLAILCATVVIVLCILGLWSSKFRDNWLQHVGLALLLVGAVAVLWHAAQTDRSNVRELLLLFGLALYGAGTGLKTWLLNGKASRPGAGRGTPAQR